MGLLPLKVININIIININILISINIILTTTMTTTPIYITNPYVFVSLLATTGAASIAQMPSLFLEFCETDVLFVIVTNICNGKIKGLAILT